MNVCFVCSNSMKTYCITTNVNDSGNRIAKYYTAFKTVECNEKYLRQTLLSIPTFNSYFSHVHKWNTPC